jgi:3-deoxy-D-manno-octulosonic-acid transferase
MYRRGNLKEGFGERFGFFNKKIKEKIRKFDRPIWIHAVSIGEAMIAEVLLREIRRIHPFQTIVLSVTTSTARQVAKKLEDKYTAVIYKPIDFFWANKFAYRMIKPRLVILIEKEIWANHIWEAHRRKTPIWMVNASMSDRSKERFKKFNFFIKHVITDISWVGLQMQYKNDYERFVDAGYEPHKLFRVGSLKYDVAELGSVNQDIAYSLRDTLKWSESDPIIITGSTFEGEEEIFLEILGRIKKEIPNLKLILAPRHAERRDNVVATCQKFPFYFIQRSKMESLPINVAPDVFILDSTGELRHLYWLGTVTFIGKSLTAHGGQNFIEPIRSSSATVVGPYMENYLSLAEEFKSKNALIQVQNKEELEAAIIDLLKNPEKRVAYCKRSFDVYQSYLGAGKRTAEYVSSILEKI